MGSEKGKILFKNQDVTLDSLTPSLGKPALDVRTLGGYGFYTFDAGFYSTASCISKITFIDGDKGQLLYRGYPIDQLAAKLPYEKVVYLLLYGELPSIDQYKTFRGELEAHSNVDACVSNILPHFDRDAHPMGMLISLFGALASEYHSQIHLEDEKSRILSALRMIAKAPSLAAMCYRHGQGLPLIPYDKSLGYAENFIHMLFAESTHDKLNPILAKAMDKILTLHADHEQNASTTAVRVAGSTGANPFSAIASGIAALWGPAHGGANEACLKMLKLIGDESQIEKYIAKAKDKDDPFRLMGFGHRVYKNYDPRAIVMRSICHEVLEAMGKKDDPLFKLAMKLEKIALEDDYFIEKKLYPNVDFYSGITQTALGIPMNLFTVVFALARTAGWSAQWLEMMNDHGRLARPRQIYQGYTERNLPEGA